MQHTHQCNVPAAYQCQKMLCCESSTESVKICRGKSQSEKEREDEINCCENTYFFILKVGPSTLYHFLKEETTDFLSMYYFALVVF